MNLTSPSPTELGQIVGLVILTLLWLTALAGIGLGVAGLIRRDTNSACALALVIALTTFLLVNATVLAMSRITSPEAFKAVIALLGLLMLAGFLTGPVLAVVGLRSYYQAPRRWLRGAFAGWSALAVSMLLIVSLAVTFLVRYGTSQGLAKWLPKDAIRMADGQWQFTDYNFKFRPPEGSWTLQNPTAAHLTHQVVLEKISPKRFLVLVPEKLAPSIAGGVDAKGIAEFAKNYIRNGDANASILREAPAEIGGLRGIRFEAENTLGLMRMFSVEWCFARRGWAYQIILRGPQAEAEAVRKEAAALFAGFSVLDEDRAAPGWEALAGDRFRSTNYPCSVNLAGAEWRLFPNVTNAFPAAEFAALDAQDRQLVVLPFALPPTPLPPEAITTALLAPSPYSEQAKNFQDRKPWHQGDLQGETVTLERNDLAEPWLGRLRFVWGRQTAWLLVAGGAMKAGLATAQLDSLLDRVVIKDSAPAVSAEQLPPGRRRGQALFLNQLGLHPFQAGHFEEADTLFRQASALWPANPIYLANQCEALASLKQYSNGLARLEARLPIVVTNLSLRATRAFFELRTGDTNAAIRQYRELFDEGFGQTSHLSVFARLLLETGQTNDAVVRVEAFARTNTAPAAKILQANLLRQIDDLPGAVRVLKAERDRSGLSADLGYTLADIYLGQGEASAAYEVSESLLAKGYETASSWTLRGRAELQLKNLPEARKSFEAAAKLDPENGTLRASLARVSAMLGQADNSAIKNPLPPVTIPVELTRDWPAPLPPDQVAPHGAQYLDRATAIHFEAGKERRETSKWRVTIYDRIGLERFDTLYFDFDPLHEEIYVNELVVRDRDGHVVSTGRVDDYYVSDDSTQAAQAIASQRKQLNVPVSGLQPGHTLEVTITRRDRVPPTEFAWLDDVFQRQTPAARLLAYVEGDVDRLRWEASPEVKLLRGDHFLAWQCDRTPAWAAEPLEPVSFPYRPRLWVTDGRLAWTTEITNYLAVLAEKLGPDAETRAAHALETAGISGQEERIRALAKFVQSRCTYRAIEFGRRARVPNRAGETLQHHYGDCKDQAVLLHELLALSGVPSHLVLANPAQPVHTNLPSLDQFTHMLVYLPGDGGGRFVDTTGQLVDPFITPSLSLGGRAVLVLDPLNPRFMDVPPLLPDSARVNVEREVKITDGADVLIEEDVTANGVAAAWFRMVLNASDGSTFKTQAQRLLGGELPACEVVSLEGKGFDNSLEPVRFHFKARIRNQFQRVGDRLVGTLPVVWEPFWFASGPPADRRAPIEIRQPYQVSVQTVLVLPTGYDWPDARKSAATRNGDFADSSLGVSGRGDALLLKSRCALHTGVFPAVRHEERRQALTESVRLMAPSLVLEKVAITAKKK